MNWNKTAIVVTRLIQYFILTILFWKVYQSGYGISKIEVLIWAILLVATIVMRALPTYKKWIFKEDKV